MLCWHAASTKRTTLLSFFFYNTEFGDHTCSGKSNHQKTQLLKKCDSMKAFHPPHAHLAIILQCSGFRACIAIALALPTSLPAPPTRMLVQSVCARQTIGVWFSGNPYTYQDFVDYYGEEDAPKMWAAAKPYELST